MKTVSCPSASCFFLILLGLVIPHAVGQVSNTVPSAREHLEPIPGTFLKQVQDIRALSKVEAARQLPVQLQGVVTYADKGWRHFFIQDASGGIYVRGWQDGLQSGQWVEVQGVTDPGKTARMVVDVSIHSLGRTNFPKPRHVTFEELISSAHDSTWVEVDGVIRSLSADPARMTFRVATEQGVFNAVVPGVSNLDSRRWMVNTQARLQGVCANIANAREQVEGFMLRVPTMQFIQTLELAPTNAFAIPVRPIGEVNRSSLATLGVRRIRVQGTVTLKDSDGVFYLQDQSGALRIFSRQTNVFNVGKGLDVVGFPATDGNSIGLDEAIFRYNTSTSEVEPKPIEVKDMLAPGNYQHELVVVAGTLLKEAGGTTLPALLLQSGSIAFQARFAGAASKTSVPVWHQGSQLRLTGVREIQPGVDQKQGSFIMLLRSPEDVEVLNEPPWMESRVLWSLVGGLTLLLLMIIGWVTLLRRQVRERSKELVAAKAIFQAAMDCSQAGIIIADAPDGKLRYINKTALFLSGKPAKELVPGSDLPDFAALGQLHYPDGISVKEDDLPLARAIRRGETCSQEFVIHPSDGLNRFVLANAVPVRDGQGKIEAGMVVFLDITQRKRAELEQEKLQIQNRQLQKSESLGRMAAAIAHHFNNQLQAVMMSLELAKYDLPRDGEAVVSLTEALQSARKAAEMSSLMLTYLGQTPTKLEPLYLAEACLRSLALLRAVMPQNVALETDLPTPGPAVNANSNQLQQVLTNLVTNAWEAISDKPGTIRLSVKTVAAAAIPSTHRFPIDWHPQASIYACLEVADTGCGITHGDIEKLFDPFYSSKFTGRGLGLPVVLGIARAHCGLVTVESEPGRGSIFRIFLPVLVAAVPQQSVPAIPAPQMARNGAVLVVEDEPAVRKVVTLALKREGFTVFAANDGVEALELFGQHQAEIRCVLCDLTMPRMDGWKTLEALRKLAPDIPVILASGYNEAQVLAGHHPELPQAFLNKPYVIEELRKTLALVLAKAEST